MSSIIKKAPLDLFVRNKTFALKEVTPRYRYEGEKRTDVVEGYAYRVVNIGSLDTFTIVVPGKTPIVSQEALTDALNDENMIYVEFDNAVVTPYYSSRSNSIEDSIKADAIRLSKDK